MRQRIRRRLNMSTATKALSIRQPWAWLIVNGLKDIENRSWPTNFRGRIYVHAGKGMTREEYEAAFDTAVAANIGIELPPFDKLERGGIVGAVDIVDCVQESTSLWFFGPFGFALKNAKTMPFMPCKGSLGFFTPEP